MIRHMKKAGIPLVLVASLLISVILLSPPASADFVSPDGWGAQYPIPCESLHDIWGSSGSDVFAVGEYGTIYHYDGTSWSFMTSGSNEGLIGVWGSSASDVFAVGYSGTILHYDGTTWSPMTSGTTQDLRAVWGTSPSNVFAVGGWWDGANNHGIILYYDGDSWSVITSDLTYQLEGIWGSSDSNIIAVGSFGNIIRYNGSSWAPMSSGTTNTLVGVWGTSTTNVYAVGINGTIISYNGSAWSPMNSGTTDILMGVWGTSATNVYAVGGGNNGTILQYNGTTWETMSAHPDGMWFWEVWGSSSDFIIAVGMHGAVLRLDGNTWIYMNGTREDLRDVSGCSPSAVFAVGDNGTILHYDGNNWTEMSSGTTEDLCGVWCSSSTYVFAVGDKGTVLHYDGITWSPMSSPDPGNVYLKQIWGSSSTDIFATSGGSTIYHYNGSTWSQMDSGTTYGINDLWGTSSTDVYAVGDSGTVLHYNGSIWSPMNTGTTADLNSLWATASSDVFAVSSTGTIMHHDGSAWDSTSSPIELYGVWGSSPTDVFAVGRRAGGYWGVLHYDGISWTEMTTPPSTHYLWGVWGSSSSDVFAVGQWAYVLHYLEYSPPTLTSLNPNQGAQGDTIAVTITGDHLTGATSIEFGSGVNVNSFTVDTSTQITANISIDAGALLGPRDVSVTTPGGTATLTDSFTVYAPPQANFTADRTAVIVDQSIQFTDTSSGGVAPLSYQWDFDYDGVTLDNDSELPNPSHSYPATGTYTVALKITDSASNTHTEIKTDYISVNNAPQADFSADMTAVIVDQGIQFTDSSTGGVPPLSYQWDFDYDGVKLDNDSDFPNPSYSYPSTGTYTVALKITDSASNSHTETKTDYISVTNAPQADFSVDRTAVIVDQSVQFTDTSSGGVAPLSYQWDFDYDGVTLNNDSDLPNPSHSYPAAGTYTVALKITDSASNSHTEIKTDCISVTNAPQADFSADMTEVIINQGIQFTDSSTGGVPPLSYQWDFDYDGINLDNDSDLSNPSHTYPATGTYTVALKITDSASNSHTEIKTDYISVSQPPTINITNPNEGKQGESIDVTITGTNFTGATSTDFGSEITVNNFTCHSSTEITANISIDPCATVGEMDVSVTTPWGTAILTAGFIINYNTPTGSTVVVELTEVAVTVTFPEVTTAGCTYLITYADPLPEWDPVPDGYQIIGGGPGCDVVYGEIKTTASYSGPVTVESGYDPSCVSNVDAIRIFYWNGSDWIDANAEIFTDTDTFRVQMPTLAQGITVEPSSGYVYTPAGSQVTVVIPDYGPAVTFADVSSPGLTSMDIYFDPLPEWDPVPDGYQLIGGGPGCDVVYGEIKTTASYSGPVTVESGYDPSCVSNVDAIRIFYWNGSDWIDANAEIFTDTDTFRFQTPTLAQGIMVEPSSGYVYTPAGSQVTVVIPDYGPAVTFADVSSPGLTSMDIYFDPLPEWDPVPDGYQLIGGGPGCDVVYGEIKTTASYSGPVTVESGYDPSCVSNVDAIRIFYWNGSDWIDANAEIFTDTDTFRVQMPTLAQGIMVEPSSTVDNVPPAVITDLSISIVTTDSITLAWTAPGDDGNIGSASQYDIRLSTSFITEANWSMAIPLIPPPTPNSAGSAEACQVVSLSEETTYYFAIKTADELSNWAELSNTASGTTLGTSEDGDGIPEDVENGSPNSGDGNNDGIQDSSQEDVASLPNSTDNEYVTIESPVGTNLEKVTAIHEDSLPDEGKPNLDFTHGFFSFEITGVTPGDTVEVTLILDDPVPVGTEYWKFGPTPSDPTYHWYQLPPIGDDDGDNVIIITLVDGGLGDDDLTADGIIIDQGGPGNPPPAPTGGTGVPVFPSLYIGMAAAFGAAILAFGLRRRLVRLT